MQLGMIGLGRMGANMVRRLLQAGHDCVVWDRDEKVARALGGGSKPAASPTDLLAKLNAPRVVWIMIPAAAVDAMLQSLAPALREGDIIVDGGNSNFHDDIRRARELKARGVRYLDVGTSGGVWGLERGYCLMVGGDAQAVHTIDPVLASLADDSGVPSSTASTAARGYLHCGPSGSGHFVKMVHNGIEYGLMAAYAEGFNLLHRVGAAAVPAVVDAETAPTRIEGLEGFDLKIDQIAELWRHGSVVSSWLLDLIAAQLAKSPQLDEFTGRVSDSGEGRWTVEAAIETGVPVPVLANALFARFSSRGEADFANRLLSAMRLGFGGHQETHATKT